ncbi:MAG: DUF86 domain-containing protein [Rhodocyclaceae bacterium]
MKTPDRDSDLARLMLNAARQISDYVAGMGKEDFLADSKTRDAVIMKLLVIGELAAKLIDADSHLVANHPSVPWRQMKGMRNRMAHGYFELDLDVVWDTIKTAIPDLEAHLSSIAGQTQ